MKKLLTLLLIMTMSISICACGNGNKKAFQTSKVAYDNITVAYEITETFGSDIYEAWRLGIQEDDKILDEGFSYLASELSLTEAELAEGAGRVVAEMLGEDWETLDEADKKKITDNPDPLLEMFKDDLFSVCVLIVSKAYIANGKVEEAQSALDTAKGKMKELSQNYSDYEHYPSLKDYYTTTSSFFEFCQNPTGSFEQVKDTINDYENEARDYVSDLDYIFEE